MPWTKSDYPDSLKNFEPRVRNKAVEIANALLDDGYEEGRAIAIATAQAKEWDENHPDHRHNHGKKVPGADRHLHVVPHDGQWAIKREGIDEPKELFATKADAVEKAQQLASDGQCDYSPA
ncbi:DUF2188 domain-containing protein [Paenibacillus mendelii]|uniref:DUF2188 domain-containing protein n=1 Tax=Paenibacillus mendelii TaxID=206163 RepID=A0ABV6JCU8_9BACL|nr:DUF2188 domain-containing protein [Paenibacillus mendelii]